MRTYTMCPAISTFCATTSKDCANAPVKKKLLEYPLDRQSNRQWGVY